MSAYKKLKNLEQQLCKAKIERVLHPLLEQKHIQLFIKREDQLHPIISGNKWRKLKYILKHAIETEQDHLISMGGLWSNHLHALAWAGKQLGLTTTGIIRSEPSAEKTATIKEVEQWGMSLIYVSRSDFRRLRTYRDHDSPPSRQYSGYWIPEGGSNELALKGVAEMMGDIDQAFNTIALACGTGTTLAGIASALADPDQNVIGFAALKGAGFLNKEVSLLLPEYAQKNWTINLDYHFGGFAKTDQKLLTFIEDFEKQTDIPLEPVYTGKMMYGLFDLISKEKFEPGHKIMAIHTGGIQGKRGFS